MPISEGSAIPNAEFVSIDGKKPQPGNTASLFSNKKVVVLGLPGAFTPTCSGSHLPRYEELYDTFKDQCGIDEIYCLSMNDGFVMNEWFKKLEIRKVKMLPDGNGKVSEALGVMESKPELGFGPRTHRSSFYIENNVVKKMFIEPFVPGDPFEVSDADTLIKAINPSVKLPHRMVIFGLHSCEYCQKAESYMKEKGYSYNFIELSEGNKMAVLGALKDGHKTTPLIFVDGEAVGGLDDFKKAF